MKRTIAVGLLMVGVVIGLVWSAPRATAGGIDGQAAIDVPDVRLGDHVRLCLDRSRSGDVAWIGGVVKSVDAAHITIRNTTIDRTDGGMQVSRPVEQWVPMSSILYVERMLDNAD